MAPPSPRLANEAELRPHDLALYTAAYKQRSSDADVFHLSLSAWNHFAATKSLLYLPNRPANSDFDGRDRRRHLWTHQQLARFGDVVETRTLELLKAQERLLRSWHEAATQVEKVVRGFIARRRVGKILDAIANAANQLERAKYLVWLLKKQIAAALIVQRAYRRHVAYCAYVDRTKPEPTPARGRRERKAPAMFSPPTEQKARSRRSKPAIPSVTVATREPESAEDAEREVPLPEYKRIEGRVRNHVKRLRYQLAFVEAYEAEGWRRASREKLKPSKDLATATAKILADKRAVVDALHEMLALQRGDTQYPQLAAHSAGEAALLADDIYCSRCGSTEADAANDILICDNDGCARAYHQRCQTPWVRAESVPAGDELWYCEVCLAVFNSLKLVNSAFGTTFDTVQDLFPDLEAEEKEAAAAESGDARRGVVVASGGDAENSGDDEADEDFVLDGNDDEQRSDGEDESDSGSDSEESDSGVRAAGDPRDRDGESDHDGSGDDDVVSDQELQYLRPADVIDADRRSMRSREKQQQPPQQSAPPSLLGQRAAKVDAASGRVVFGVIVEEQEAQLWQVVYFDDTMAMLTLSQAQAAVACAREHDATHREAADANSADDDDDADADAVHDPQLILHGKRKRTQVNYRELNAAMFAGKADSDEEADADACEGDAAVARAAAAAAAALDDEEADEDYVPKPKKKTSKQAAADRTSRAGTQEGDGPDSVERSRRARKSVDYNALNEGLLSY